MSLSARAFLTAPGQLAPPVFVLIGHESTMLVVSDRKMCAFCFVLFRKLRGVAFTSEQHLVFCLLTGLIFMRDITVIAPFTTTREEDRTVARPPRLLIFAASTQLLSMPMPQDVKYSKNMLWTISHSNGVVNDFF